MKRHFIAFVLKLVSQDDVRKMLFKIQFFVIAVKKRDTGVTFPYINAGRIDEASNIDNEGPTF